MAARALLPQNPIPAASCRPGGQCLQVHFRVEFEFKGRLTAAAWNHAFEALCGTIVDAFARRAQSIYGAGNG